jgi:cell division protein FtsB
LSARVANATRADKNVRISYSMRPSAWEQFEVRSSGHMGHKALAGGRGAFYVRHMKRISFLFVILALLVAPAARAQDAATEERLNKLNGLIEDQKAAIEALKARVVDLNKEIAGLRDQVGKPTGNYASAEDVKTLAENVRKIDSNRIQDFEKVRADLQKLRDALLKPISTTPGSTKKGNTTTSTGDTNTPVSDKGYEYVIQSGDLLSKIVAAYKEKGIKVTVDQIVKANPGLNPNNLTVGKKIFIPAQ